MAGYRWEYPPRLSLAQLPTPLQPLLRYSAHIQKQNPKAPALWVKRDDLSGCVESGNKIRKLEFLLARAHQESASVVITCGGIQSNHCRATAAAAARLGLKSHLLLRGELPQGKAASGNLLLNYFCGAKTSFYRKPDFQKNIDQYFKQWAEHYREKGETVFLIPTGGSNGTGVWGYVKACEELSADFQSNDFHGNTAILCAAGSGGTQAGLLAGTQLHELDAKVFGVNVCDDESWFVSKIKHDLAEWAGEYSALAGSLPGGFDCVAQNATPRILDGYVGKAYAIAHQGIFDTISELASLEGIVLDPVYTGKAFYGMTDKLLGGYFDDYENLVFIHTGGVFGLLADESREQICLL